MINKETKKVVHQFNKENDRWIYIEYSNSEKIIGLNFMQGDDYELFQTMYCESDDKIIRFYNNMVIHFPIEKQSVSNINFINKCLWAYVEAGIGKQKSDNSLLL